MIYLLFGLPPADRLTPFLPPDRAEKAERLSKAGRAASAAAYLLFRYAAAREWDLPLSAKLPISFSPLGKPYTPSLPGRYWNLSHTENAVSCVLSDRPCGIDLQAHRKIGQPVLRRVCTPAEYEAALQSDRLFFRFWCCKESYGKCRDLPLFTALRLNAFAAAANDRVTLDGLPFFLREWDGCTMAVCGGEEETVTVSANDLLTWLENEIE